MDALEVLTDINADVSFAMVNQIPHDNSRSAVSIIISAGTCLLPQLWYHSRQLSQFVAPINLTAQSDQSAVVIVRNGGYDCPGLSMSG